jgi:hypothetical protein
MPLCRPRIHPLVGAPFMGFGVGRDLTMPSAGEPLAYDTVDESGKKRQIDGQR